MAFHRVTLDGPLCGRQPPRPVDPDECGIPRYLRYGWTPSTYLEVTVPQRVLTQALSSGTPQGARTALRMLGAAGTEGHPLWDVLAQAEGGAT